MNSILITGCNRGLGLGLVKALVKLPKPPQHLFATCRNKEQAKVNRHCRHTHPHYYYCGFSRTRYRVLVCSTMTCKFSCAAADRDYLLLMGAIFKRFSSSTEILLITINNSKSFTANIF